MDLLTGIRFSVASHGVAAAYAGWLLRQFGADVDHATALDPEGLGGFLGEGARFVPEPAFDAPVTGANREQLEAIASGARVIWITPWGSAGEMSERLATDLTLHAAGGWLSAVGEPGREPLGPPGAQGQFAAGLYAAIAALVPGAPATGLTDVPIVEAVVATLIYDAVAFQYHGTQPTLVTLPVADGHIGRRQVRRRPSASTMPRSSPRWGWMTP